MKILFVGEVQMGERQRGFQRMRALQALGHEVIVVPLDVKEDRQYSFLEKVMWRMGFAPDSARANRALRLAISKRADFDVVWIEKGLAIRIGTLVYIKKHSQAKLMSLSEDDMHARHNQSRYYRKGLKYYDVVFTTKTYNLKELLEDGAKRTELFLDAYDPNLHRPLPLTLEERARFSAEASFIGTFEEERAEDLKYLAENGIPIAVWGNGWESYQNKHQNLIIKNKPVYGEDYAKAINATKINFCFLRKINRDVVTSRSVEIPACGGFMLGERTSRHLQFFREGQEAEFFGSREELLEKTKYYLSHDAERQKIALAGRERCEKSGYDHATQMRKILEAASSV